MIKNIVRISAPLEDEVICKLKAGDRVLLEGVIYTARDAAHKHMAEALEKRGELPFDVKGQIIYYAGMCPAKPGYVAGPAGPTTSGRMDIYTPSLLRCGLKGMLGKGDRHEDVVKAIKEYNSIYFGAIGGAAVCIAECIKKEEIIAYADLGTEAVRKLWVEDLPVFVLIDSYGNNVYKTEPLKYKGKYAGRIECEENSDA